MKRRENDCHIGAPESIMLDRRVEYRLREELHVLQGRTFPRSGWGIALFTLALLCAPKPACFGQAFTASLTGVVTDATSAAIPGVNVKLTNTGTGDSRETSTGGEGRYTFSQLLPGNYDLNAESPGFKTFVQRAIVLRANQSAELSFSMQLGEVTESIEVAAATLQLDTQTANQTVTLNQDMVMNLPLNARNPFVLVHATAGVTAAHTGISTATSDQNHNRFGMNGGRTESSLIMLDGISAASGSGWNGLIYAPSVDSVQEVQVVRNSYDAQFGKSGGGVVSVVTKSGSNEFHGTVFEFLRNSALDANSWANNRAGRDKVTFQRNQFGGNFAGPIWKSKRLFFFGGYEGLRQGRPSTSTVTLPTAEQRRGDFSQTLNANRTLSMIYDPFTTRPGPDGKPIRDAFPGNVIPSNRFDPVGKNYVDLYPQPNTAGNPITNANNYFGAGKGTDTTDRADIKIDWVQNEKHTLYGRYSEAFRLDGDPPAGVWLSLGGTGSQHRNRRYHMTIGDTIVPNPTWVINILAGHGIWTEGQTSPWYGLAGTVGFPSSLLAVFDAPTLPQIYPADYSNISHSRFLDLKSRIDNGQVNVTKEWGTHSIRFGFAFESARQTGGGIFSGDFRFNRGMTSGPVAALNSTTSGNSIASLLLGTGSSGNIPTRPLMATNKMYYALYLQDSWRVNRRLTVNYGLRWETQKPTTERYNRGSNFFYDEVNPLGQRVGMNLKGGLVFLNEDNRYQWDPDYIDFAPRIGIAYKITDKLVMRTGYGVFFPPVLGGIYSIGYSADTPWVTSLGGDGITPFNLLSNPVPDGLVPAIGSSRGLETNLGLGVGDFPRDIPSGYIQNYSLDLQFEISPNTVLEVGYAGNQGRKMSYGFGRNDNQLLTNLLSLGSQLDQKVPNPFYGQIKTGSLSAATIPYHFLLRQFPQFTSVDLGGTSAGASSSYNALVAKFTKQFSRGLLLLVTYQFSKAIDNSSERQSWEYDGDGWRDYKNGSIERSISSHDIPHSFVTSAVYELPIGRGKQWAADMHPVVDALVGGWQMSTIVRFGSGFPIRVTAPSTISQYGFGVQMPNISDLKAVQLDDPRPERWFNTSVFSAPAPYSYGTIPRRWTQMRADGVAHADFAIMKNFQVKELARIQFRAEFFNLTNTPQFSRPNASFGSNAFGTVTGTTNVGPRNVQFGLKISF